MGAHHPRHSSAEDSSGLHRLALLVIAPLAVITLVAMLWLWPDPLPEPEGQSRLPEVTGTVTGVDRVECEESARRGQRLRDGIRRPRRRVPDR